MQAMTMRSA